MKGRDMSTRNLVIIGVIVLGVTGMTAFTFTRGNAAELIILAAPPITALLVLAHERGWLDK